MLKNSLQKSKRKSFLNSSSGKRIASKIRGLKYSKEDYQVDGKDVGDVFVDSLKRATKPRNVLRNKG